MVDSISRKEMQPDDDNVKLDFWGLSYGTLLGATYASMFPDNVGKMILDGVLEPSDFVNHHWAGSVEDTELALKSFYEHCAAAGPIDWNDWSKGCHLASNGSTAADVRERVQGILMKLYHNPMWFSGPYGPDVVSYSIAKNIIFSSLYSPIITFPNLAQILYTIEQDDKSVIAQYAASNGLPTGLASSAPMYPVGNDAGMVCVSFPNWYEPFNSGLITYFT